MAYDEKDASLLAAAPDMLASLEELVDRVELKPRSANAMFSILARARMAIRKARNMG